MKVWAAIHETRHGFINRVFDSYQKVQDWKDEIGKLEWGSISTAPIPDDSCGDEYFDLAGEMRGQYFYYDECEVE